VSAGRSSTVEVRTSLQRGLPASVELSATGAAAGVTLSFDPSVIAAGGFSVLTIMASQDAAAIATNCTVHARFGSSTRELLLLVDSAGNTATTAPAAVMVRNGEGGSVKTQGCGSTAISPLAALLSLVWLAGRRRDGSRLG